MIIITVQITDYGRIFNRGILCCGFSIIITKKVCVFVVVTCLLQLNTSDPDRKNINSGNARHDLLVIENGNVNELCERA